MKTTTTNKLSNRILKYGTLALALGSLVDSNSQVKYVDLNPDLGGSGQIDHFIDLDGDGTDDIRFRHGNSYSNNNLYAFNLNGNSIMGLASYRGNRFYYFPFALDENTPISAGANWQSFSSQIMEYQCYRSSQWCGGVMDKYLGLRFKIGSDVHYAWIRLDVGVNTADWKIKDYAYDESPNAGIMAGVGLLSYENNFFTNVKVIAKNNSITLSNLPEKSKYKLYNLSGQSVIEGKVKNDTFIIDGSTISDGVYIIELQNENSEGILRKKIVL